MLRTTARIVTLAVSLSLIPCTPRAGDEAPVAERKTKYFDVILLVDGSPEMASLSRKSAMVVIEAMVDKHRLGITIFGKEARVLRPLDRIATVGEKLSALSTLQEAAFVDDTVDLRAGLASAMKQLETGGNANAEKVIILLAGAPFLPSSNQDVESFKATLPPELLKKKIVLHAVAGSKTNFPLIQLTANLSGGKCLAAFDVATMTDALDALVERLQPPEEIVITKEVPVKTVITPTGLDLTPDQKAARNQQISKYFTIAAVFAGIVILLVLGQGALQLYTLRQIHAQARASRRDTKGKQKDKSKFAELRDLANALTNTVVDASEMLEQLNLDLEDFGVEKWRHEKEMDKRYGNLTRHLFLMLDHLEVSSSDLSMEAAAWLRQKIETILDDGGIEEMTVKPGDEFDGQYHKHVAAEASDLPDGAVVSVKRKGYWIDASDKSGDKVVLRQTEVVVSQNKRPKSD